MLNFFFFFRIEYLFSSFKWKRRRRKRRRRREKRGRGSVSQNDIHSLSIHSWIFLISLQRRNNRDRKLIFYKTPRDITLHYLHYVTVCILFNFCLSRSLRLEFEIGIVNWNYKHINCNVKRKKKVKKIIYVLNPTSSVE